MIFIVFSLILSCKESNNSPVLRDVKVSIQNIELTFSEFTDLMYTNLSEKNNETLNNVSWYNKINNNIDLSDQELAENIKINFKDKSFSLFLNPQIFSLLKIYNNDGKDSKITEKYTNIITKTKDWNQFGLALSEMRNNIPSEEKDYVIGYFSRLFTGAFNNRLYNIVQIMIEKKIISELTQDKIGNFISALKNIDLNSFEEDQFKDLLKMFSDVKDILYTDKNERFISKSRYMVDIFDNLDKGKNKQDKGLGNINTNNYKIAYKELLKIINETESSKTVIYDFLYFYKNIFKFALSHDDLYTDEIFNFISNDWFIKEIRKSIVYYYVDNKDKLLGFIKQENVKKEESVWYKKFDSLKEN
jgi:hypothetical protein